ncbi:sodium/sugar symporter [Candidatus Sulfidibacterium hydrothermale]|uniref:sodium/sugar symporter n=1 Tax=Candidatus Sulfidibacterium hydrothermale TaxID=2875962 RepID=UPI001F0A9735|nr:sodium/sugar symporter [Candidatus Sulfidibacterium hydrothermale]UBM62625.1 sodium/sugar symporter [Candidatus Sulfidibacterium hydrothermale]
MTAGFSTLDYIIFGAYAALIITVGLWVSRNKKGKEKTSNDYFLASNSLTWWAVGASLIAANISAEQFIGMSGSGYAIGLGIASYEWMSAITLIIVGKYFLPVFLKAKIYTMPQYIVRRYDNRVRTILAVFWLLVYVFVNLTSVLYLGALAIQSIMGVPLLWGVIGLAAFAAAYSLYGGLSSVAWTDVIQVIFLIGGGLATTYLALNAIPETHGVIQGFKYLIHEAPQKFHMILHKGNPYYMDLPGISVLVGGMWVANLYYWGFNQYIIQRALAAKSKSEAQKGIIFAGFLKILTPLIVVIPGIAAFVLTKDTNLLATLGPAAHQHLPSAQHADYAYPWLLGLLPYGVKGIAFAALAAAIVSSLASMLNSTSTIFTMDIYKQFKKDATERNLVRVGRTTAAIALLIAVAIAPMLQTLDQAFQYIQEYTGMVSPGILAIFLFGLFWKRATSNSALWAAIFTIPVSMFFKFVFPQVPWMNQMGYSFLIISAIIVIISLLEKKTESKAIPVSKELFHTDTAFNVGAVAITAIIATLYIIFW